MKKIYWVVMISIFTGIFLVGCDILSLMNPSYQSQPLDEEDSLLTGGVVRTIESEYEEHKDWPVNFGDSVIAAWHDDKVGAFALTIDDNHGQDVSWWLDIGERYDFPFTWFLIPDKLYDYETTAPGGYWKLYQDAFAAGHDIQSHTFSHLNELAAGNTTIEQEYQWAIDQIEENIPGQVVETLAHVGGTNSNLNDIDLSMDYYVGARGSVNHINGMSFDHTSTKAISPAADLFEEGSWLYAPRILDASDEDKFRGFICMYYHDVSFGSDPEALKAHTLEILDYIDANRDDIWMGKFRDIVKYAKERDSVHAANGLYSSASVDEISISLVSDGTLNGHHDYPLTLKVKIDPDWMNMTALQDGNPLHAEVVLHDGEYYAYVHAVPDEGNIILNRNSIN